MKYNTKWTVIGLFIPIIGILIANRMDAKDKEKKCSLRRGSAISTLFIFIAIIIFFLIYMSVTYANSK